MNLRGNRFNPFPEGPRLRLGRVAIYAALIVSGAGLFSLLDSGRIQPLYSPTPTPTRPAASHLAEGQAFFDAGQLDEAILAYQRALALDPGNAELWIELARIQTYSSDLVTTDADRSARLGDAQQSIARALELAPENPTAYAIKALVLDWSADPGLVGVERSSALLNEAAQSAVKALQLEPNNPLALAFMAEVLADQLNWSQALDVGEQAVGLAPQVMDVHRAYAKVLESSGDYTGAIESYQRAIALNPNLPFLYLSMGANYRYRRKPPDDPNAAQRDIDLALEAYSMAARAQPEEPAAVSLDRQHLRQPGRVLHRRAQCAEGADPRPDQCRHLRAPGRALLSRAQLRGQPAGAALRGARLHLGGERGRPPPGRGRPGAGRDRAAALGQHAQLLLHLRLGAGLLRRAAPRPSRSSPSCAPHPGWTATSKASFRSGSRSAPAPRPRSSATPTP